MVRNGGAFCGFSVRCNHASGAQSSCCGGPTCGCMRTPTHECAGYLPSFYPSAASCVAGEQVFDDSCSLRPSTSRKLANAEIALINTILIYEPEVRARARGAVRTIPKVDSPLLTPPPHPWRERHPLTCLPLHDDDAWPSCAVDSARCSSSLPDIKAFILAFSLSCTRPSADFLRPVVALRIESACRGRAPPVGPEWLWSVRRVRVASGVYLVVLGLCTCLVYLMNYLETKGFIQ